MLNTNIIKLGGTSVDIEEKMVRVAQQVKDDFAEEQIFLVLSAMGKTTDKIDNAIKEAKEGKMTSPEEVYVEFEKSTLSSKLRGYRDSIYLSFSEMLKGAANGDLEEKDKLHVSGDKLSAFSLSEVLKEAGIEAVFIDFKDSSFPLIVKGNFGNATLDLTKSKEMANRLRSNYPRVTVFPGYGGIELNGRKRIIKTLGRGGSDTAAFGYGYVLGANVILIGTDVDGLKSANIEGAKVLEEVNIDEAKVIAFYGAKFPSHISLNPLEIMYREGRNPVVRVVNGKNLRTHGTQIVRKSKDTGYIQPVKFVGGRPITTYEIEGSLQPLLNELFRSGIDWFFLGLNNFSGVLGVSERTNDDARNLIEKNVKDGLVNCDYGHNGEATMVGMVGSGMQYQNVSERRDSALHRAGININYFYDPSLVSTGVIIDRPQMTKAIHALYNEFLQSKTQ